MNRRALAAGLALLGAALAGCSAGTETPAEPGSTTAAQEQTTAPETTAPETTATETTATETTTAPETASAAPEETSSPAEETSEDPFAGLDADTGTGADNLKLPEGFALPDGVQVGQWQRGAGAYSIEIKSPGIDALLSFYRTWLPENGYVIDADAAGMMSFSKNGAVGTITAFTGTPTITYAGS